MEPLPKPTFEQHIKGLMAAVETMTQDQINACAWCMGASGCGWTKASLLSQFQRELERETNRPKYTEVMG